MSDLDEFYREQDRPRRTQWFDLLIALLLAVFAVFVMCQSSCSTVTPDRVRAAGASFDGDQRNSGFLGFLPDGGGHLTANARVRYNLLVEQYGQRFRPALTKDAGITELPDGTFRIDRQHLIDFETMNELRRASIR